MNRMKKAAKYLQAVDKHWPDGQRFHFRHVENLFPVDKGKRTVTNRLSDLAEVDPVTGSPPQLDRLGGGWYRRRQPGDPFNPDMEQHGLKRERRPGARKDDADEDVGCDPAHCYWEWQGEVICDLAGYAARDVVCRACGKVERRPWRGVKHTDGTWS